jgi:hypothetical protein
VSRMCPATDRKTVQKGGHLRSVRLLVRRTFWRIRYASATGLIRLLIRRLWVQVPPPERFEHAGSRRDSRRWGPSTVSSSGQIWDKSDREGTGIAIGCSEVVAGVIGGLTGAALRPHVERHIPSRGRLSAAQREVERAWIDHEACGLVQKDRRSAVPIRTSRFAIRRSYLSALARPRSVAGSRTPPIVDALH